MKRTMWVFALAASAILATNVVAQQLRQPESVRPVAYNYGYLGMQEAQASPSDQPVPPPDAPPSPPMDTGAATVGTEVSVTDTGGASSYGNYGACCPSRCVSGCSSCGFGLLDGCGLFGLGLLPCSSGEAWTLFPQDNCLGIRIGGWSQTGYHNRNNGLFNAHPGKIRQNQTWLYIEREADGAQGLDVGFRLDTVYGVDAQDTQAFGNPPGTWDYLNGFDHGIYGWAFPQAYAEAAYGDFSLKAGHFFTLVGYEVVTSPDNFFYSHSYTMYNSEPFTHTGLLGTYSMADDIEVYLGWTLGWDTGFERLGDGSNFLGGFSAPLTDYAKMTYITTIGDMGDYLAPFSVGRGDGYTHSIVFDVEVTENLNYVLQSDFVSLNTGGVNHNDEYGVNQYLFYKLNDCWSYGNRLEWWKSDNGFDFGGQVPTVAPGSVSYYEYTSGLNYRPTPNMVVRPELRFEWSPANNFDQQGVGVDFIVTF